MDIRQAVADDGPDIRNVARASLHASYDFLSDEAVDTAVERWYSKDALETALADPDVLFLIAEDGPDMAAFSQSVLVHGGQTTGELDWLHVRPEIRGGGLGTRLLEGTAQALEEMGADRIQGLVLAGNEEGAEFYEEHGYAEVNRRPVTVGDETFEEIVYRRGGATDHTATLTETTETESGETLYLAWDEADRGSEAPLIPVYRSADRTGRYGLLCGNCESLDVAMDSMGGAECSECGNSQKPTRWDAVYL
jgi:ribosomal protein S18 acetylase RimI-like enzyme